MNLFKKLDFPDPNQATQSLILWQLYQKGAITPEQYLPSFQVQASPTAIPGEQPGTGGPAISMVNGPEAGVQVPQPGSNEATDIQSKQIMASVPITK